MALQFLPLVAADPAVTYRLIAERINQLIQLLGAFSSSINAPAGQSATFYVNGNGSADTVGDLLLQLNASNNARLKNLANGALILGTNGGEQFEINANGTFTLTIASFTNFANDAAAATGGIPIGGLYRNGSVMQIRVT